MAPIRCDPLSEYPFDWIAYPITPKAVCPETLRLATLWTASTDVISLRYVRGRSGQCMAIECASVQVVRKPWGRTDLRPWSGIEAFHDAVGELWFQRVDKNAPDPDRKS